MKNIKILLLSFVCILLILGNFNVYATNNTSSSNGYNEVIIMNDFDLITTILNNGGIHTSWNKYNISNEKLKYYKLIRSTNNPNPVYPEDGYIKYSSDINFTEYTDNNPKNGINYYRVCAITYDNNRYCSGVKKVNFIKEENDTKICTSDYTPVCGELYNGKIKTFSNKCVLDKSNYKYLYSGECKSEEKIKNNINNDLKNKIDSIINNFIKKIEKKYSSNEKKVEILNSVIERFEQVIISKPNSKYIVNYYIEAINKHLNNYNDIMIDLNDILNEY